TDGVHERGLHRGTPVVDVAGVDDQVDLVLLHDRLDERPRGRVEVQVGDVQRADGTGVRLVTGQRRDGAVEPADVVDQPLQLGLVRVEPVGDVARVADDGRRVGQQAVVLGFLDRVRAEGEQREGAAAGDDQQGQAAAD